MGAQVIEQQQLALDRAAQDEVLVEHGDREQSAGHHVVGASHHVPGPAGDPAEDGVSGRRVGECQGVGSVHAATIGSTCFGRVTMRWLVIDAGRRNRPRSPSGRADRGQEAEPGRALRTRSIASSVRVRSLWRYPVKSLQGEQLSEVSVGPEGLEGDRRYAIFDEATGYGLTARRAPELLFASASWRPDGTVVIALPDGGQADDDEALSRWLGRPVTLRSADHEGTRAYENPELVREDGTDDRWEPFNGARGAFHDSARTRVSLVSQGSLRGWDARRFRANVVLDGSGEDALVGSEVTLGDARLDIRKEIDRCVMTTRPQPGGIDRDLEVLRTIRSERHGRLCVGALVASPGMVRVGDELVPGADRR